MRGIEEINYWNEGENYRYYFAGRPPILYSGKPATNNEHQSSIKAPQATNKHSLLIIKEVLDALLLARDGLPPEVQQALEMARAAVASSYSAE